MDADFWHQRWEQGQIGFHQDEVNCHLQAFWSEVAVQPGDTIFVPLSGKTRDMLWLRSKGCNILGIEISALAVAAFFEENGLEPVVSKQGCFERWESDGLVLLVGDFFDLQVEDLSAVKAVYDRAALIALPAEMRQRYVEQMREILPASIQTLLVTLEYNQEEMSGPPFSVEESEVERLYAASHEITRLLALDILPENPRFQKKGLGHLEEKVFRLVPLK